jgi:hypothetical protein
MIMLQLASASIHRSASSVVKTGLKCLGKCMTMKDLVQCRKLEAKFRQLAVSDPTKRFIWLAEAEKWEHEAEAEIASHSKHAMLCELPVQLTNSHKI